MKFKGKVVTNSNVEYAVFPRGDEQVVFIAKPVFSMDPFNELCKEPKPPTITYPEGTGKAPTQDYTDANYKKQLTDYFTKRSAWLILTSIKDSPEIEWETVDMLNPDTYVNYEKELQDSQFLNAEINKITEAVYTVNALDERQLDRARESFLASLAAQDAS